MVVESGATRSAGNGLPALMRQTAKGTKMNITESVGFFSPYGSLEEALAQWNHDGTQMVAISEPKPVLIREHNSDTGKPYLFQSHQCYVNVRYSPRGRWSKCNILTFSTDRYGTPE